MSKKIFLLNQYRIYDVEVKKLKNLYKTGKISKKEYDVRMAQLKAQLKVIVSRVENFKF